MGGGEGNEDLDRIWTVQTEMFVEILHVFNAPSAYLLYWLAILSRIQGKENEDGTEHVLQCVRLNPGP